MMPIAQPQQDYDISTLWQNILHDLRDVFDVHYVCARFSHHVARLTGTRTLVAVADAEAKCYDLWLADETGEVSQRRWTNDEAGIDHLSRYIAPVILEKFERPAVEVISSQLWLETRQRLIFSSLTAERRFH